VVDYPVLYLPTAMSCPYSVTMEAQVPSAPFFLPQGFDVDHSPEEEEYNELPIARDHLPWNVIGLPPRSREPSVVALEPPKHPTVEDWDKIKPVFTKLYRTENKPLKDVQSIIEQHHGFVAT